MPAGGAYARTPSISFVSWEAAVVNHYARSLIVCGCLGMVAAIGASCGGIANTAGGGAPSTAGAPNSPSTAGAPSTAGTPSTPTAPAAAGAPSGTITSGTAGASGAPGRFATAEAILPVDATGFVSLPTLGIRGAWYGYGDGQGSDGTVASSDCVKLGMHSPADCSAISTPPFGYFPQITPGKMCTSGTAAEVVNGRVGCTPPVTTCWDFRYLYGAGIGLDLNNAGSDASTSKQPFNATMDSIVGISFDLDAPPLSGLRVEFPTLGTEDLAAIWKPGTSNLSPLVAGHNVLLFADVASPTFVKPAVPFDPTKLLSVQFHVPARNSAPAAYSFCISNLAVVMRP